MPVPDVVSRLAIRDVPHPERRARLGRALVALSHDLAESRPTVLALQPENAELRERLRRGGGG